LSPSSASLAFNFCVCTQPEACFWNKYSAPLPEATSLSSEAITAQSPSIATFSPKIVPPTESDGRSFCTWHCALAR
jgi:hypothetical protein